MYICQESNNCNFETCPHKEQHEERVSCLHGKISCPHICIELLCSNCKYYYENVDNTITQDELEQACKFCVDYSHFTLPDSEPKKKRKHKRHKNSEVSVLIKFRYGQNGIMTDTIVIKENEFTEDNLKTMYPTLIDYRRL